MKETVVYSNKLPLEKLYWGGDLVDFVIETYIIKKTYQFLWFKWNKFYIQQIGNKLPKTDLYFELGTQRIIIACSTTEYDKAKLKLMQIKNESR